MYTQDDAFGWEQSSAFKKAFSIDVDVEFLGVWWVVVPFFVKHRPIFDQTQTGTQSIPSA